MSKELSIIPSLKPAPKGDDRSLDERADAVRQFADSAKRSMQQGCLWFYLTGRELAAARDALGETRGRPAASGSSAATGAGERLTFETWIEAQQAAFTQSSGARGFEFGRAAVFRYMKFATAVNDRLIEKSGIDKRLLAVSPLELDDKDRAMLDAAANGFIDDRTFAEVAQECGVIKQKKSGSGGGGAPAELDPETPDAGFTPEEWKIYCKADPEGRAHADRCRMIAQELRELVEAPPMLAPAIFRKELAAAITHARKANFTTKNTKKGDAK